MITISLAAEKIFEIGGYAVTNAVLMTWLAVILLVIVAVALLRKPKLIPRGFQNIFESLVEWVVEMLEPSFGSREKAEKYFPFIATFFIFILAANWLGIFPFLGAFGMNEFHEGHNVFVPFLRSPASDINFTLALALISVLATQFFGIAAIGFAKHVGKYLTLKNPIATFVGLLEIISEIAKIVSFSFRLFGNVFAGEVLLVSIGFLVPYFAPLPFLFLELFVGFIQALVFAMLTTVFLGIATVDHH